MVNGSSVSRALQIAEILSIGSELTTGETRDTNAAELARSLSEAGVVIGRLSAVPDRLETVEEAFRAALSRSDLVISSGGLGPTPDDLTREAMAAVCEETPVVDPGLERWLRDLWTRRGLPFPALNLKQAWLIPSASAIANRNGTAPGWWVDRDDGRIAVLLPGPPREMRPMWRDEVLPRLRRAGLGADHAVRILRLWGIGESAVADLLGEDLLRRQNPEVATYARSDAVDVRLSAIPEPAADGQTGATPDALLDDVESTVLAAIAQYVWARGETTWREAIGAELHRLGWTVSIRERGTAGSLAALLAGESWLDRAEALAPADPSGRRVDLESEANAVRSEGGSSIGIVVLARPRGADTAVSVAVALPSRVVRRRMVVFLGGEQGRNRAGLSAAGILLETLRGSS